MRIVVCHFATFYIITTPTCSYANKEGDQYSDSFFHTTCGFWNSLPANVLPDSQNLSAFKRQVYHFLHVSFTFHSNGGDKEVMSLSHWFAMKKNETFFTDSNTDGVKPPSVRLTIRPNSLKDIFILCEKMSTGIHKFNLAPQG